VPALAVSDLTSQSRLRADSGERPTGPLRAHFGFDRVLNEHVLDLANELAISEPAIVVSVLQERRSGRTFEIAQQ